MLPYAPDAWYTPTNIKVGYEVNFNRNFYKLKPMRTLREIATDILRIEHESSGLLEGILSL